MTSALAPGFAGGSTSDPAWTEASGEPGAGVSTLVSGSRISGSPKSLGVPWHQGDHGGIWASFLGEDEAMLRADFGICFLTFSTGAPATNLPVLWAITGAPGTNNIQIEFCVALLPHPGFESIKRICMVSNNLKRQTPSTSGGVSTWSHSRRFALNLSSFSSWACQMLLMRRAWELFVIRLKQQHIVWRCICIRICVSVCVCMCVSKTQEPWSEHLGPCSPSSIHHGLFLTFRYLPLKSCKMQAAGWTYHLQPLTSQSCCAQWTCQARNLLAKDIQGAKPRKHQQNSSISDVNNSEQLRTAPNSESGPKNLRILKSWLVKTIRKFNFLTLFGGNCTTFWNCCRVAQNCCRIAQNCCRVAPTISPRFGCERCPNWKVYELRSKLFRIHLIVAEASWYMLSLVRFYLR